MLPVAHGVFSLLQLLAGFLRTNSQRFLLRLQHVQLFLDTGQLLFVLLQLPGQLPLIRQGLIKLSRHLPAAFPLVFEALFNTGDIGASLVIAGLGAVEVLGAVLVTVPESFQ